jgi:hypothetical protein
MSTVQTTQPSSNSPTQRETQRARRSHRASLDPAIVAAITETKDQIRVVLGTTAAPDPEMASRAAAAIADLPRKVERVAILDRATFIAGKWDQVASWLRERRAGVVLRVASSSRCIAKVISVPELEAGTAMNRTALTEALRILAEAEAPAMPWWRRAAGTLPRLNADWRDVAIVTGLSGAQSDSGDGAILAERIEGKGGGKIVTEVAALAGLASSVGEVVLAARADSSTGSVSIIAQGQGDAGRTLVRAVKADAPDTTAWERSIRAILAETAEAAGLPLVRVSAIHPGHPVFLDLTGEVASPSWAIDWGMAIGALAIWGNHDEAVRPLASITLDEPQPLVSARDRAIRYFAKPSRAAAIIAVSVAAMVLIPLSTAWGRLKILERRAAAAHLEQRSAEGKRSVGFYSTLRERRWPMAKLLADLAGNAPPGVEIDSIELAQGEAVAIRGTAERYGLVEKFRTDLAETRVFSELTTPSVESGESGEGVRFQLTARVTGSGAIYPAKWQGDYTATSLGAQKFGQDWKEPEIAHQPEDSRSRSAARTRDRESAGSSRRNGNSTAAGSSSSAPSAAAPFVPPPPLTDADIAKMDRTAAMKEFGSRKAAAAKAVDPDVKRRLNEEAEKAKQRMQSAPTTGGTP